jgi:hypothetical protein
MKNKLFSLASLILTMIVLLNLIPVAAATTEICNPQITLVNQDPSPAVPNEYMKVIFELTGIGNCNGFTVKLNPEYPFSLDADSSDIQTIEGNPSSPDYRDVWTVPYKIRIDKDALDGDYNLKLQYQEGVDESFGYVEKGFNVTIKNSMTAFDAVIQQISGSDVSIAIANTGKYAANSVVVRIPEQESFKISGTDGQMVGNLASGDYTVVGFTLTKTNSGLRNMSRTNNPSNMPASNPSASSKLKFDIYYTDNIGERRIVNMELPLNIGNASAMGVGNFNRTATKTSSWYSSWTNWIIILGILIILYFLFRKYPNQIKHLLNKIKRKNISSSENKKVPDWVRNAKEREKNK